jgi:hypothetical protein
LLDPDSAKKLVEELLAAFEASDFQSSLLDLLRKGGGPDVGAALSRLQGREELCLATQNGVLPGYGFDVSAAGMHEALEALTVAALESEELAAGLEALHDSLGLDSPQLSRSQRLDCESYQCALPWVM